MSTDRVSDALGEAHKALKFAFPYSIDDLYGEGEDIHLVISTKASEYTFRVRAIIQERAMSDVVLGAAMRGILDKQLNSIGEFFGASNCHGYMQEWDDMYQRLPAKAA